MVILWFNKYNKMFKFSKYDKFKLAGMLIKAVTGVVGGSLVLTEGHPYITLAVLALGAAADQFVTIVKEKGSKDVQE